jgi:hypothetical protein
MVGVNKDGSNVINIDYFKLDFNRYAWGAPSRTGLIFGAILFIMINKSPSASPLSLERGGGLAGVVPRDCEALRRIKWQLKQKAEDEAETVFLIEALKRNKRNISKTTLEVKMDRRQLQNLIRKHRVVVKEWKGRYSSAR